MTTRVWDYLPEYAVEKEDILDAVQKGFRSGQLVLATPGQLGALTAHGHYVNVQARTPPS